MDNNIETAIIQYNNNPSKILSFTFYLFIINILFIYISCFYNYQTYCEVMGIYNNNELSIFVPINEVLVITNNNHIIIDNIDYKYIINSIDENLIVDNNNNYQKINIIVSLPKKYQINNNIIKGKIQKENKKIIKYLVNYLRKE